MSKFNVIPKNGGDPKYSGTPTFTGTYMKPGMLEFREVASPTPIEWNAGDYVVYSRLGNRVYRLYNTPQVKKQARSTEYGGAFIYQNVQFFDDSKQLEICPFRDLVQGDNRIHFSTQPSISTFEAVDGLARRFQACLEDMYGVGSWVVRVATVSGDGISQGLADLMAEPREFTVSGVNLLQCLDKVYEIWPEVGWIYKVESNKNTIIIGGAGLNNNVGTYQYGKGNGLRSITRTIANADELANRIFAYGSSRNMLPRWYNSQNIKDAESVDIQHLMIPISEWGTTNVDGTNLPDPAKAYVEDVTSQAAIGLRPTTVYFDGSGDYPEIYPTIRETTIKMVRDALGSSSAKYYPSTAKYPNENERVDRLLTAPSTFDDGLAGDEGKSAAVTDSVALGTMTGSAQVSGGSNATVVLFHEDYTMTKTRLTDITLSAFGSGTLTTQGGTGAVYLVISIQKSNGGTFEEIKRQSYELEADENNVYQFRSASCTAADTDVTIGDVVRVYFSFYIANTNGEEALSYSYSVSPNVNFSAAWSRKKTFTVSIRQIGFDIGAQADLGDGKTIAMLTGKCAGRTFAIKSVQFNPTTETWNLECYRSEDESLSQWFPNTDFPVRGLENAGQQDEYVGDEFVLLDIAMPDIYIGMAESKLLTEAQGLLTDTATERWQYIPDIDAKYMVENSRVIWAGEYMTLSDDDVLETSPTSILVDSVTINEGEAAIPTYKVTLRDRKRKTWTESASATGISSKPVSNATQESLSALSTQTADSYFMLDGSGNVTLKSKYQNLWVPGWLAAGGVGSPGGGGGGASYLNDLEDVNAPTPTANDLLAWNGSSWVNSSNYYTKAQVDSMVSTSLTPVVADSLPTASIATMYKMYFVPSSDPQAGNVKDEYITVFDGTDYSWEQVGSTAVDLSGKQDTLISGTNIQTLNSHSILNSGDYPIGDLTLIPNMDNVTPKRTIEYDRASTAWFPIFKRTNTGVSSIDDVVDRLLFRITMTGTGIHHVMDCLIIFRPLINTSPAFYYWNSSISTSATYLGLYQMRLIYPKELNSGYDWALEAYAYKKTTRHIKIEVFQDTEDITWLTTPTSSIYNSTYHTSGGNHTLSTLGFRSYTYLNVNVDYATSSAFLTSYLPVFPGNGSVFTSGAALASGNVAFMSTDGLLYPVSNTSKPIRPETGIFLMGTSYDANTGLGYAYVRDKGATITFANTSATYGTFAKGDEIYLRCTMSNGQIYSDGYLSPTPTSGYTWISIGVAQSDTAGGYSMVGKSFFTLDANGKLTHVNGKSITDYGLTARVTALEDLFEIVDGNVHVKNGRGLYSDSWIAAGGIGSGGSGGAGELNDLADVTINSSTLANGDLLVYNSVATKWENVPQSQIAPTISVVVPSSGNALTGASASGGTITFTTGTFATSSDLVGYVPTSRTVNGHALTSDVTVSKGDVGLGNVENTALSTWTGSTNITTLGTITAGTWNGTAIGVTKGGTGLTSISKGAILYGSASNTIATLSANGTSTKKFLTQTSDNAPAWSTIGFGDLPTMYSLGTQIASSAAVGNMLGVSALSANLSTSDSDTSQIVWDSAKSAWHFRGNLYADGWVAAGGVGSSSGGGYGVEEITTNQDGTVDFRFTGGDVTTVDLNHEHPQYPKYVLCANQAAYDAITTKESDTLYLIPETT